jgi:uncharacterized protein YoxC
MKLPSDTPKLPKLIFLAGDVALIVTAWYIAGHSARPMTGMTLLSIASCVIVGVVIGAIPFVADYARRQDEALDDRQRSLHSLSVTVAASAEQIAIAATGLQGLAEAAQDNLGKSERISTQIQEKMAELEALLASAKRDDGEAAARLESVARKIGAIMASFEAAAARAAEAVRAIPPIPASAPEVAPVPASRIVKIRPAAAPSDSPFEAPATPVASAAAPEPKTEPDPVAAPVPETPAVPAAAPVSGAASAPEPAPASAPAPAPRKRGPRKPTPAPAAPAPDLVLESPPPPDAELPLAPVFPEAAEPAVSADGATRLVVTASIGIGNRLFIRGDGPGLGWDKGVPLTFVSIGKWRWETNDASKAVKFKLYKNDETECTALGERSIEPGAQQDLTAAF